LAKSDPVGLKEYTAFTYSVISQKNRILKLYYNFTDKNITTNTNTDDDGDEGEEEKQIF
jgi:hypothetical protein